MIATERKHIYTARAFDSNNTYVCHKAKILSRVAVREYKREARKQHKNIAYWRVFNETLDRTVEK